MEVWFGAGGRENNGCKIHRLIDRDDKIIYTFNGKERSRSLFLVRGDLLSFGHLALKYGYLSIEQLQEALREQKRRASTGRKQKLGEILVELGYLSRAQVVEIFRRQASSGARPQLENYRILEQIGKGAMGAVYKALQLSLNRTVALKILPPSLATDKKYIARFLQEAKVVAQLNHENIIYVIDVGESQGVYYYAMEYVEGKTVKRMVEENGPLDKTQVVDIAIQAARALECACSHGIVHRDIKPANIMVTPEGVVKLCDFGLARQLDMDVRGVTATIAGTPYYISPEQIRNDPLDTRTDIYALGGTMYFMATGSVPFTGRSPAIVMTKHLYEKPVPPHLKNSAIPRQLEMIILRCLQKRPEDRFQSPTDLLNALIHLRRGKKPSGRVRPRRRRHIRRGFRK